MPIYSGVSVSGKGGYGDPITAYWKNKKMDNSTSILTSTNYLKLGDVVCWSPALTDGNGKAGIVVGRPETRNLSMVAGYVYSLPSATFGSTGSPADQQEGEILIMPFSTGLANVMVKANLGSAGTTTVLLVPADASFQLVAAANMSADAAGTVLTTTVVGRAITDGTDTSGNADSARVTQSILFGGRWTV